MCSLSVSTCLPFSQANIFRGWIERGVSHISCIWYTGKYLPPCKGSAKQFVLIVLKYDLHVHDDIEYYLLYRVDESGSIVVMISFTQFFQGCRHIIISDSELWRGNSWIFFHFFFFYWHIIFLYCTFNVLRQLLKLIKISIKILSFNVNHMTETKLKIWTIDFRWSPSLRKFFQFFFFFTLH